VRALESAIKMLEPIAKINLKITAKGPKNRVILLY